MNSLLTCRGPQPLATAADWRWRIHVSHSVAPATMARNGNAPRFMRSQPAALTSAPDENDEMTMTMNTIASLRPWVFALGAGAEVAGSGVVPPVYMRFQSRPSVTGATENCQIAIPDTAT